MISELCWSFIYFADIIIYIYSHTLLLLWHCGNIVRARTHIFTANTGVWRVQIRERAHCSQISFRLRSVDHTAWDERKRDDARANVFESFCSDFFFFSFFRQPSRHSRERNAVTMIYFGKILFYRLHGWCGKNYWTLFAKSRIFH